MTKLVDKWFLGADHPAASGTYARVQGTLYDANGPDYLDMQQGNVGDCYLIASIRALPHCNPATVESMIIDNGDDTWTILFLPRTAETTTCRWTACSPSTALVT